MNSYQLNHTFDYVNIAKKQEEWRRKQFSIFYGSGRPIFNICEETEHLRFHRSPAHTKDANIRTCIGKETNDTISNICA
jgi:hypothetical protein